MGANTTTAAFPRLQASFSMLAAARPAFDVQHLSTLDLNVAHLLDHSSSP